MSNVARLVVMAAMGLACFSVERAIADCNGNGIPDECDISCGAPSGPCDVPGCGQSSGDCDADGVPDECEGDCNANGVPDDCEIASSTGCPTGVCTADCLPDTDQNCIPDECGACCGPFECTQVLEAACGDPDGEIEGGEYAGDSTSCDAVACTFVPTVSQWGLAAMTLLVLAGGSVVIARRQGVKAA